MDHFRGFGVSLPLCVRAIFIPAVAVRQQSTCSCCKGIRTNYLLNISSLLCHYPFIGSGWVGFLFMFMFVCCVHKWSSLRDKNPAPAQGPKEATWRLPVGTITCVYFSFFLLSSCTSYHSRLRTSPALGYSCFKDCLK